MGYLLPFSLKTYFRIVRTTRRRPWYLKINRFIRRFLFLLLLLRLLFFSDDSFFASIYVAFFAFFVSFSFAFLPFAVFYFFVLPLLALLGEVGYERPRNLGHVLEF